MRESFWKKLCRVHFADIAHVFLFLIALIPARIYKWTRPHLWLICEYSDEAQDNGYAFYRYLTSCQPQIDVVYAIRKCSPAFSKVAILGKTIEYGSFKHWIYYLAAEVNISSQKGGKPNAAVCYLFEVVLEVLRNTRVFLQHGIIKDDLPFLHEDKAKLSLFCCGAKPEYEFVRDTFGYSEEKVQYLGLCRFDQLHESKPNKDIVLIMPTWRMWLQRGNGIEGRESFLTSSYYYHWSTLLQDESFIKLLGQWKKKAIFCTHRNMQAYEDMFTSNSSNVQIISWQDADVSQLLLSAGTLITDFSSVFMDFAYMKKPLVYFQFDQEEFRKGHLPVGYFDYNRDGFGSVCRSLPELVAALNDIFLNDCEMDKKYRQRVNDFYLLHDDKNCERTYEAVLRLLNGYEKS